MKVFGVILKKCPFSTKAVFRLMDFFLFMNPYGIGTCIGIIRMSGLPLFAIVLS